jgi:hypothetical protein
MTRFDAALQESLAALTEGRWDVDECLRRYPQHADKLRPLLDTAAVFSSAYDVQPDPEFATQARERFRIATGEHLAEAYDVEPSPSFFAAARARFLMSAHRMRQAATEPVRRTAPVFGVSFRALASASLVLVLVLSASTYTVASASQALPGEWRYPIKLETERVRLALAFGDDAKRDLRLRITAERADEIARLSEHGREIGGAELTRLANETERLVREASEGTWSPEEYAKLQEVTQKQKQVLDQARDRVNRDAEPQYVRAVDISREGTEVATRGLVSSGRPVVHSPTLPLTWTPVVEPTLTPTPGTPTEEPGDAATPADPTTEPGTAETPGFGVGEPVDGVHGVSWVRLVAGQVRALIPSQDDGWRIAGVDVGTTDAPAPILVQLVNTDGTSHVTINTRNGDMWWYIAVDGRFDEVQMRQTTNGQTLVIDPDIIHSAYGSAADVPLYILGSIEVVPVPTPTPRPE